MPAPATSERRTLERARHRALVIMPAYNEAESIGSVLAEFPDQASGLDVLVVSDGSTDDTAAVARAGGAIVVELPFNLGIGGALRAGFAYAMRHGYGCAVQFDADGQHDPSQIRRLLDIVEQGADLVIGSRFAPGGTVSYPVGRIRRLAMRFLSLLVRSFAGQTFSDTTCGFRAFSRPMLELFATTYPVEYLDNVEALVLACNGGFRVEEIGVNVWARRAGTPSASRASKLAYFYLRLVIVLVVTASRERTRVRRRAARDEPAARPSAVQQPVAM